MLSLYANNHIEFLVTKTKALILFWEVNRSIFEDSFKINLKSKNSFCQDHVEQQKPL